MAMVLRSADLPVADRVDFIAEAVGSGVLPVDITWQQTADELDDLVIRVAVAGALNFSSARSRTNAFHRSARQARADHEPTIFVALQVSGTTRVEQAGRQAELHRGDMVVYDSTRPYTVENLDRTELHYFQVPRAALALPSRVLDQVLGVRISAEDNPLVPVVAPFLASLGSSDVLDRPAAAMHVVEPSIQLLRAVIATQVADADLAREPLTSSLALRVQQFVHAHLGDRDLGPTRIAAEHHVSVRHLYATMARAGLSLHQTIQRRRLEACRRDLRDPGCAHLAVAAIGAQWGFADPSHFGRVFKAAYGLTPKDWRRLGRVGGA